MGAWIPCGCCRNVCRERLLAICCGLGAGTGGPGRFGEVPSASSRRAPSGAAGSGLLPEQNINVFAPAEENLCAWPRFAALPRSLLPHSGNWVWWGKVGVGGRGRPHPPPSSWFLFPHSENSSAPTRNSWRFRVAPAFWGEQRWEMGGLGRGLLQGEEQL